MAKKKSNPAPSIPFEGAIYTPPSNVSGTTSPQITQDFAYGQDIARWAVLQPFTQNFQYQVGSILALFDGNFDSFVDFIYETPAASATNTLIFDFGKILHVRGALLSTSVSVTGNNGNTGSIELQFSQDGVNYTSLGTNSVTTPYTASGGGSYIWADIEMGENDVRYFKIIFKYTNVTGANPHLRAYNFSVIV